MLLANTNMALSVPAAGAKCGPHNIGIAPFSLLVLLEAVGQRPTRERGDGKGLVLRKTLALRVRREMNEMEGGESK